MKHPGQNLSRLCDQSRRELDSALQEVERVDSSNQVIANYADDASSVSAAGIELAQETQTTFDELHCNSNEIGDVIRLIDNVAGETHLLALNATIEAARAGEAGAGFAVVAAEVKTLASQTADATQKVHERISAIQSSAEKSIEAMHSIVDVVTKIGELQQHIAKEIHAQDGMTQSLESHLSEVSTHLKALASQTSDQTAAVLAS